jgi:hypothetical protein
MGKSLGMTGVSSPQTYPGLSAGAKNDLAEILILKATDNKKVAFLLEEIDFAVKAYHAALALQRNTRPSEVRARLRETTDAALALGERLNALDGQTLWLLQKGSEDPVARMRSEITQFLQALSPASKVASEQHRRGGRLPDIPKRLLVAQIAHLLRTNTKIKPTTAKGGMLEQIVQVLVTDIDRRRSGKSISDDDRSVHELVLKGLKVRVTKHDSGALEFDPWVE